MLASTARIAPLVVLMNLATLVRSFPLDGSPVVMGTSSQPFRSRHTGDSGFRFEPSDSFQQHQIATKLTPILGTEDTHGFSQNSGSAASAGIGMGCGFRGVCGNTCCSRFVPTPADVPRACPSVLQQYVPAAGGCVDCVVSPHPLCPRPITWQAPPTAGVSTEPRMKSAQ